MNNNLGTELRLFLLFIFLLLLKLFDATHAISTTILAAAKEPLPVLTQRNSAQAMKHNA